MSQYSSIRIYTSEEDIGEIVFFVLFVIVNEIGKRLDKDRRCPVYCATDHKHYFWENYEKKYEQEDNLQAIDGIHITTGDPGKE